VLSHDVLVVSKSLSDLLGHGIECTIAVLVALGIQFTISWKLSLISLTFAPLCVLELTWQPIAVSYTKLTSPLVFPHGVDHTRCAALGCASGSGLCRSFGTVPRDWARLLPGRDN
jgi:hypothetical protein